MQERRTRPATPADFHRLVDLAHERGLQLFQRARAGSAARPASAAAATTSPG